MVLSNSKTALGLAILAPFLAGVTLFISKTMRISPGRSFYCPCRLATPHLPTYLTLTFLAAFHIFYTAISTLTGRTIIWDFAKYEIARRPLLGWGYQSFWLVGPDGPSIVDAPGWVKTMPNAHNGYYDTMLEIGYVGLCFAGSLHRHSPPRLARMAYHDPARAWLVLSLALFIIVHNFLESTWMRGFEFLWVVFLILVAEIARYGHPFPGSHPHAGAQLDVLHHNCVGPGVVPPSDFHREQSVPAHHHNHPPHWPARRCELALAALRA